MTHRGSNSWNIIEVDSGTYDTSSDDEEFYVAGRFRKNGWHCRARHTPTPPEYGLPEKSYHNLGRKSSLSQLMGSSVDLGKPATPDHQTAVIPATAVQSDPSVHGFYNFMATASVSDYNMVRRNDSPVQPERRHGSFCPAAYDRAHPPPRLPPPKPRAQRPTVYRTTTPNISLADLSVVLDDAPKVIHTTAVTVSKNNGQHTINEYAVLRELGRGSFGKVKLVRHIPTGRLFAMKALQPFSCHTQILQRRLQATRREIAVMKRVRHPHMVRLHEVLGDKRAGKLYMVMQYISGGSIAKKVTEWAIQPIPEALLKVQARQLLSALKYMLVNGVVHRDIKPDNILVDESQNVYLADFGMSAVCTGEGVSGVEGTPAFMAPELCRGDSCVSGDKVDIWALGVSLYQLMYGTLPFTAPTQLQLSESILKQPLTFPDQWAGSSGVVPVKRSSPEFKELIEGMLEKDPLRRWDVRRALQCTWLADVISVGSQPADRFFTDRTPDALEIATCDNGPLQQDIAPYELEDAIIVVSDDGSDV